ncbi:IS1380 family transposase [Streptomyces johnsoniae]|uniref:IS1380 family transposase n=1 Tax=Streptomyces johnsoniae TaxID=3075532 RepID=A0ABU2SEK7_9ACTN|nr:IS1380 family transposase [Streptomyces sp. DSM 41886]MDT0447400.1 IS1380 family transposase [Streptomyces sp. DSM 41886]
MPAGGTFCVHTTVSRPRLVVSTDGRGVVSHARSRLLADLAEVTGLTSAFSDALRRLRPRGTGHAPGRIAADLSVILADGGEVIADLALLRNQPEVFGPVASAPTAWRLLADIGTAALGDLRAARATAREIAWAQAGETRESFPVSHAGGQELPGLVLDIDATLVTCHSEKEHAAPTYKRGFGYHPLLCFLDNTGEALAGLLRPGNAAANTAADHITVLDTALAQIPDAHRHGTDILIRTDSAGSAKTFLNHIRALRSRGIRTGFSVGWSITEPVRRAIRHLPEHVWHPALEQDGTLRTGAQVAELTGLADLPGLPKDTRIIVRRERPHPGAQLSLFDCEEGMRHQVFLTDTPHTGGGSAQYLEVRHRAHARVEDRIRCGKTTGFGRFPSRHFALNQAWLELSLAAIDLLAWTKALLLDGELATAEPKKLRHRLLHAAARITRGGRRLYLRIAATWPWRHELTSAFTRLATLPRPAT